MICQNFSADLLYHDPDIVRFYDLENEWAADQDYCAMLADNARSILDLGCGTGLLASALAEHRDVVGVDPAPAMLAVARARQHGEKVAWVEDDARTVRLNRCFDLIVLTGHAFQVFLTAADQHAVLNTIAVHLTPNGRFIFDMRNPASEAWREWTPEDSRRYIQHPHLGDVEAWNDAIHDDETGVVTYQTHYRAVDSGQHFSAASDIVFTPKEILADRITGAGLLIHQWFGDWHGGEYTPQSADIIPVGGLAPPD